MRFLRLTQNYSFYSYTPSHVRRLYDESQGKRGGIFLSFFQYSFCRPKKYPLSLIVRSTKHLLRRRREHRVVETGERRAHLEEEASSSPFAPSAEALLLMMPPDVGSSDVGSSSPNGKLERSYTAAKDRERLDFAKSGLQSEAAQGNIGVVLERLLKLDSKVDPRDVPAVYKRALLRFHPDRHVGKPLGKRASYEERCAHIIVIIIIIIVSSFFRPARAFFSSFPASRLSCFASKDRDGGDRVGGRSNVDKRAFEILKARVDHILLTVCVIP